MVSWAGFTSIGVGVPESWRSASAPVGSVHCREVGRADALAFGCIPDVVGGAVLTLLGGWVKVFGRSTIAGAGGGSNSAGRAADLAGSGGGGACRADTCEESLVKDHTLGTAC